MAAISPKVTPGRIVLFRRAVDFYAPALVAKVNEDGTVNLTVFLPKGDTVGVQNIPEGEKVENWTWPGVDAGKVEVASGQKEAKTTTEAAQRQETVLKK